jgi:hypothetical protein
MKKEQIIEIFSKAKGSEATYEEINWFCAYKMAEELQEMSTKDLAYLIQNPEGITNWEQTIGYIEDTIECFIDDEEGDPESIEEQEKHLLEWIGPWFKGNRN